MPISHPNSATRSIQATGVAVAIEKTTGHRPLTESHRSLPHRLFEHHAKQTPCKLAATYRDYAITYHELNRSANQIAHWMIAQGIGAESRIAVLMQPSVDIIIALLAILKSGGAYVPIDPDYPEVRIATILEDVEPALILINHNLRTKIQYANAKVLNLMSSWPSFGNSSDFNIDIDPRPDDTAYAFYTSGTTGHPKGTLLSYANLEYYISTAANKYGVNADDVVPTIARPSFSISLFELLTPIASGGRIIILDRDHVLNFSQLAAILETATLIHASPSLLVGLLPHIKFNYNNFSPFNNIRHASTGGDTAPHEVLKNLGKVFKKADIYVIYGCTEIACMGCTQRIHRDRNISENYIGEPFPGANIVLVDEALASTPKGSAGEICIHSPGLMKGYLNQPTLTSEAFIKILDKTYYRTGDLGKFATTGELELLGRRDHQMKIRGMRVEPTEVELQLRRAPNIRDAIVATADVSGLAKRLIAYVVPDDAGEVSISEIRLFLATRLPDYMLPSAYIVLDSLPLNNNMKIDRNALPLATPEILASTKTTILPRNDIEQRLTEIWSAELHVEDIGVNSNFFEAGGNSLIAVNILIEIKKEWGFSLPTSAFLEVATIEKLAHMIDNDPNCNSEGDIVTLQQGAEGAGIFCLYGILTFRDFANSLGQDQTVHCVAPVFEEELFLLGNVTKIRKEFSTFSKVVERYLKIVRGHQPNGPYIVAGHSWGGAIALELAKRLARSGDSVPLVILFDSSEPNFLARYNRIQPLRVLCKSPSLALQKTKERIGRMIQRGREYRRPIDARKYGYNSLRVQARNLANRQYRTTQYDGLVVLFKATDQRKFSVDHPSLGWADHLRRLEVFEVPGDHYSMMVAPNVEVITNILRRYISPKSSSS